MNMSGKVTTLLLEMFLTFLDFFGKIGIQGTRVGVTPRQMLKKITSNFWCRKT